MNNIVGFGLFIDAGSIPAEPTNSHPRRNCTSHKCQLEWIYLLAQGQYIEETRLALWMYGGPFMVCWHRVVCW